MSFLYPLGLLGLIGIPILILIYILKNKYIEQSSSSNYIWHLSEKFLKNKRPISKLAGIISLILQCALIAIISVAIAHPVLSLKDKANDYYFVLDASGSMNTMMNKNTRFENGKKEIKEIINDSFNGSTYSLILVSNESKVIYEQLESKDKACELLDSVLCSYQDTNCLNTLSYLQNKVDNNSYVKVYLVTDKNYNTENINLINLSSEITNCSLDNVAYQISNDELKVSGELISTNVTEERTITLLINGDVVETQNVTPVNNSKITFEFTSEQIDFNEIKVLINETDELQNDNSYIIYNLTKEHDYKTLLVSDQATYLKSLINTFAISSLDVMSTKKYNDSVNGYGLYIFDNYTPEVLPTDGSIWFFNASASIKGSGFTVQSEIENEEGVLLEKTSNKTELAKTLLAGTSNSSLYVNKYYKYGIYREYQTLYSIDGQPVIFTCLNENSNREVVFSFDLHNSNLPLEMDYIILSKNLLNYSFPEIIDSTNYVCGDNVSINVLPSCRSIKVTSPSAETSYLDINNEIANLETTEAGVYTLEVNLNDEIKTFNIFVSVPESERTNIDKKEDFKIVNNENSKKKDGKYDNLIFVFILISLLFIVEWMVYCYEQYQLR